MAGRASIVGAAVTHVGKVRDHNEDAHFSDGDAGLFLVCDGMGGHAAGEVASAIAVKTIRARWLDGHVRRLADAWLAQRTAETRKQLIGALRAGVLAAHDQILAEGTRDEAKSGMGTTVVGAIVVGSELVFAHAGDSRAYIVRDGIAMQLTEDHTLLARLLAAGIDVDISGEGARFRSMLTNALGIGQECKVSTFVVPLADGDRFLLCSDGVSEYVRESEVGTVLTKEPTPVRAAERFVQLALDRGGADNATAVVISVIEAGATPQPAEHLRLDDEAIQRCPLWAPRLSPQQRLRALRIAISRDHSAGERIPAHTLGDRVAWIVLEGALTYEGKERGPGTLIYPESLIQGAPVPDRDALAVARSDVRALALRADDFRELCDDDPELGETLLETVGALVASGNRRSGRRTRVGSRADTEAERAPSNSDVIEPPPPVMAPLPISARSSSQEQGQARPTRKLQQSPPSGTATARGTASAPGGSATPRAATPPGGTPRAATPPGGTPRAATPPSGTATARGAAGAPSQGSGPQASRPGTPLPSLQSRASSQPGARPVASPQAPPTRATPLSMRAAHEPSPSDTETDVVAEDYAEIIAETGPSPPSRFRRAPSEPEIETFYELDAEAPPLPAPPGPGGGGDDDDFAEMTVSVEDDSGGERVTERVTDTHDATMILTLAEDIDEETVTVAETAATVTDDEMAEEEPTRTNTLIPGDPSASGTLPGRKD